MIVVLDTLTIQELSKLPILTDCDAHLAEGKPLLKSLNDIGLYYSSFYQLNSFDASIRLASKGLGIALLPTKIAHRLDSNIEMERIRVKDLSKSHFKHDICVSYLEGNKIAEKMAVFIKTKLK